MINPAVREEFHSLSRHPAFQELIRTLGRREPGRVSLSGLTLTAKALYLTLLWQNLEHPLLVIVDTNRRAEVLASLLDTFYDLLIAGKGSPRPLLIPALDVFPGQNLSPHSEIKAQRAVGLYRLASGKTSITVTPVASALLRTEPPEYHRRLALTLRTGDEISLDDLAQHLESVGYEKREPVEMEGEYSIRGGIFDVFPAEAHRPVRIEFFGDTVESLRRFDPETQRSILKIEEFTALPLEEAQRTPDMLRELAEKTGRPGLVPGETFPGWELLTPLVRPRTHTIESLLDRPIVVWDEPELARETAARLWKRIEPAEETPQIDPGLIFLRWGELQAANTERREVELRELALEPPPHGIIQLAIPSRPSTAFRNNIQAAINQARSLVEHGSRVAFFASASGELERLADIFTEYKLPFQLGIEVEGRTPGYLAERAYLAMNMASVYLVQGMVRRGVEFPDSRLTIIGFEDLFEASALVAEGPSPRSHVAAFTPESLDLVPGDYVVHVQHGVGRFAALRQVGNGDGAQDFMMLEYAGDAKLYVPLTRLDLIQKYRSSGDATPPLDKLGGVTWSKTKSKVKAKMRDMAEELLKLYAGRKMASGFAFSPDSAWQREFEEAFEYTPTRDQSQAVVEIKRDMEASSPMDRLLCGDVGFGKTEVAMRAAFKALGDGKQVAILAPTTVLALQHFETFRRRMAAFPIRVEMLSRFRTPKEIKTILAGLAAGKVDILVGTHRLLSKDVEFPDLGLLVVDEEQRFGVRHKERLKQLKQNLDVLTLSATPIPRTLHMSLLGLRDMSVIETPPKDRLAIHTVVAKFNKDLIKTAIEQELSRGGQVYFVHNRVESIWTRAAMLQELVPQASITVGHGQMGEEDLEKVLLGFMHHEYDIFVCTTIVENGLDIPLANTMVIENAERYGLSELYQLRGRVGRSNRRAYAYLLVPEDAELTEVARKRLAALKEFSDLGAGFKIAALDLELRGAGNLLGGEQHGHIAAVGYETYLKLLDETARELRGEEVLPEVHATLNLGMDIRIPHDYIADEQQRLRAYKRIADAGEPEKAAKLLAELEDRYGALPDAVRLLAGFSQLKTQAERMGVETMDRRGGGVNIKFHPESRVDPRKLMRLVGETEGAQFTPAGVLRLPLPP
ncbi:MAG: transcription-repair coupling factor, partial [Bryobacterales bacterium]|nr:transcription-repair coupling factor [Bryobacterales bacterium]